MKPLLFCGKFAGASFTAFLEERGSIEKLDCTPKNQEGTFAAGEIRRNKKIAAFSCVFLTKIKVDPENRYTKTLH